MRERLLDATLAVIFDEGTARATAEKICKKAGVSRGAQTHHFPTKAKMLVAAIERISRKHDDHMRAEVENLNPGKDPSLAYLDLMWDTFQDQYYVQVGLDMYAQARTDADLQQAMATFDQNLIENTREFAEQLDGNLLEPELAGELMELSVFLLRGLALHRGLHSDAERQRRRIFDLWLNIFARILNDPSITAPMSIE